MGAPALARAAALAPKATATDNRRVFGFCVGATLKRTSARKCALGNHLWVAAVIFGLLPGPVGATSLRLEKPSKAASSEDNEAKVAELFEKGAAAREAGEFAKAAAYFHEAYSLLPGENAEVRASMMLMEVEALRSAHRQDDDPKFLCDAEKATGAYVEDVKHLFGDDAQELQDVQKTEEIRQELRAELDALAPKGKSFDCDDPEHLSRTTAGEQDTEVDTSDPKPRTDNRRKLQLAGGITTGVGILGVGLMTTGLIVGWRAERAGQARIDMVSQQGMSLPPDDPELAKITKSGRTGNILAIVGGAVSVMALAAGIPLLVLGTRSQKSVARIGPVFTRRTLGASLTLAF